MRTRAALLAFALVGALPASASAATFCVGAPPGCSGTTSPTLQAALTATSAAPGADEIRLGAGTFDAGATPFAVGDPDAVSIAGLGRATTTLAAAGADDVLDASGTGGRVSLSDVTVQMTPGANHDGVLGPATVPLVLTRVDVLNPAQAASASSNVVFGAGGGSWTIGRSEGGSGGYGASANGGTVALRDVELSGDVGFGAFQATTATLERSRFTGIYAGVYANEDGNVTVRDSLVRARPGAGLPRGLFALSSSPGETPAINATHVTIVGAAAGRALQASSGDATGSATIALSHAAVSGFATSIHADQLGASVTTVTTNRSAYADVTATSGAPTITPTNRLAPTFGFVSPTDFRLRFDSPLVDAGDPSFTTVVDETDLDGVPRMVNGRVDVGAYEYGRRAPTVTASGPTATSVGQASTFTASASDPDPGDTLIYRWDFGDGATSSEVAPTHVYASAPGASRAWSVTVTDPTGRTGSAGGTVAVVPNSPSFIVPPPPITCGTCGTPKLAAPRISDLTLKRRFKAAPSACASASASTVARGSRSSSSVAVGSASPASVRSRRRAR